VLEQLGGRGCERGVALEQGFAFWVDGFVKVVRVRWSDSIDFDVAHRYGLFRPAYTVMIIPLPSSDDLIQVTLQLLILTHQNLTILLQLFDLSLYLRVPT